MPHSLTVTSPTGETFNLIEEKWTVGLKSGGIQGLVAEPTDHAETLIGYPGQVLQAQSWEKLTGSLTVYATPDKVQPFRRAFHHRKPTQITVDGGSHGPLTLDVRAGRIEEPEVEPEDEDVIELKVPLTADNPLWRSAKKTGTGSVSITNDGVGRISTVVRWQGAGGTLVVPSGAGIALPPTDQTRLLHLDSLESLAVTDEAGIIDYAMMSLLSAALPERIPEGSTRVFIAPAGAAIEWHVYYPSPWE